MAIPFYENEEQLHNQHQVSQEIDQVDGPIVHSPTVAEHPGPNTNQVNQASINQQDLMAWKILALAMCKALKDHYQQNMVNSSSTSNLATASSSIPESSTAVIQILPNGQVKPQWN